VLMSVKVNFGFKNEGQSQKWAQSGHIAPKRKNRALGSVFKSLIYQIFFGRTKRTRTADLYHVKGNIFSFIV